VLSYYLMISGCSVSTGKISVLHSAISSDPGGQYANKTNEEYGEIWASAVKLAKVLFVLSIVMKSLSSIPICPNADEGCVNASENIVANNKSITGKISEYLCINYARLIDQSIKI
jgi:hypothetical protein